MNIVRTFWTPHGGETVELELLGDPFEVCNKVYEKLHGRPVNAEDQKHDALMAKRAKEKKARRK
jgi:hypothetical protein